jgi:hypothetical protein
MANRNERKEMVIKEMHSRTTVSCHLTPVRMAIPKKMKEGWECSSVLEHLPSMHQALSSISISSTHTHTQKVLTYYQWGYKFHV